MSKKKTSNLTNRQFATSDQAFMEACTKAGIPNTTRQASRWRNETGKAYKSRNAA